MIVLSNADIDALARWQGRKPGSERNMKTPQITQVNPPATLHWAMVITVSVGVCYMLEKDFTSMAIEIL